MEEPSPLSTLEENRHFTLREELRRRPMVMQEAILRNLRESAAASRFFPSMNTAPDVERQIQDTVDNTSRALFEREYGTGTPLPYTDRESAIRYYYTGGNTHEQILKGALKRELIDAGMEEVVADAVHIESVDWGDRIRYGIHLTFQAYHEVNKTVMRQNAADPLVYSMRSLAHHLVEQLARAIRREKEEEGIEAELELNGKVQRVRIIPIKEERDGRKGSG